MAGSLEISWSNKKSIDLFAGAVYAIGHKMPIAASRSANHTGAKTKTQVVRALTKQTGLKRKVIVKAVKPHKASVGNLQYEMKSRGGNISLKYFGARETRNGVIARPFGQTIIIADAFTKGGKFPNRIAKDGKRLAKGHVFRRKGDLRLPIEKVKSNVVIPDEMIQDASKQAFEKTVKDNLEQRLYYEIKRLMP